MSHYNDEKNPTGVNLDAETLASKSGEEHYVPSQASRLIPYYENLRTSVLRQSKIIHERQERIFIPKIFVLMAILASVVMTSTKFILPETVIFLSKLIHHE